jgi:hypothetical protein
MAIDLATIAAGINGFVIDGEEAGDASGYSVSSAGDVNGDGFADLIVGANFADGPGNTRADAGGAYVVFGHPGAFGAIDLAAIAGGTGGFVIHGEDAGDNAGISVAAAGDINGDGFADLVVGAFLADGPNNTREVAGANYVVFGHSGAFATVDLADVAAGAGGFVIHGEDVDDQSGFTAASAGDINGDGIDDLAIGVSSANGAGNASDFAGDGYVVFGHNGTFDAIDLADVAAGTGGFVIHGQNANDKFGAAVSLAGDFNGDHIDDLVVGAPAAGGTGTAYVIFGHTGAFGTIDLADITAGTGGFVLHGEDADDMFGSAVSWAGDINNDGLGDLVITAPFADGPAETRADAGAAYVVLGRTDGFDTITLADIAAGIGGFIIQGEDEQDNAGFSVAAAGDVNGDNFADLIIGVPEAAGPDNTHNLAGRAYVVFGHADPFATIDLADIAAGIGGFVIHGQDAGDNAGISVSAAGDVNGDGFDDLIVGAYQADGSGNARNGAGGAYVLFGSATIGSDEPPAVDAGADRTADEGQAVDLTATFTDANAGGTHTATIDWGDGTVLDATVAAGHITGSHAYADNGTYTVIVRVIDETGLVGTDSLVATINNVAPVAQNRTFSGPAEHGPPQTFAFSATDLGTADLLAFTILSSPSEGTVANNGDGTFTFNPGTSFEDLRQGETRAVNFTYRATDDDGANSAPATVTVNVAGFGDKTQTIRDTANTQPWSTQVSIFDTANRLVSETVTYDDNTKSVTLHDAANTQSWNSQVSMFDAAGRLVAKDLNNDDGSKTVTGLDTLNQHDWFDFVAGYDSQQSKTFEDIHYDDGRFRTYKQDVLNQYDWTENTNIYDNLGRKMSEEKTRDDGSHGVWKFDTLDQYEWSTDYTSYDSAWNKLGEGKTFDNGTTSSWHLPPTAQERGGADFGHNDFGSIVDRVMAALAGGGHNDSGSLADKVAAAIAGGVHSDFDLLR